MAVGVVGGEGIGGDGQDPPPGQARGTGHGRVEGVAGHGQQLGQVHLVGPAPHGEPDRRLDRRVDRHPGGVRVDLSHHLGHQVHRRDDRCVGGGVGVRWVQGDRQVEAVLLCTLRGTWGGSIEKSAAANLR